MTYITNSSHSPLDSSNTGDLTVAIIRRVKNNPYHPLATDIGWPTYYDAYVTKTNDQQTSVNVTDETHSLDEVDTGNNNALYMNHRPKLGTTITIGLDNTAAIDSGTGITDYTHGIAYFSTMPTGDFTISYLADPDKFFGEYLTQVQDSIHELEQWAGAGGAINEGAKNCEIWVDSATGTVDSKLPNRIHIRGIDRDIAIKSPDSDVTGHLITLGNQVDNIYLNSDNVQIGNSTGDLAQLDALVQVSPSTGSINPGFTESQVTGNDTGDYDALKVFGDVYIAGDLRILGNQNTMQSELTIQTSVFNDNWALNGSALIGNNTSDYAKVGGDLTVTGSLTQLGVNGGDATFGRNIVLTNSGAPSTVDGLDPSYIQKVHKYYRPGSTEWAGDCMNTLSVGILTDSGASTAGLSSSSTAGSSSADEIVDTGAYAAESAFDPAGDGSGLYYPGKFDDGNWFMRMLDGADQGAMVRVSSFDTGSGTWTLCRALGQNTSSGTSYEVINPYTCEPDFLSGAGTTLTVNASLTKPAIGNNNGIIKITTGVQNISAGSNGRYYIHLTQDDPVGDGALENYGFYAVNQKHSHSDTSIVVGEFIRDGGSFDSVVPYRPNLKYDSGWRLVESGGGTRWATSSDITIHHRIGCKFRIGDYKIQIQEAPNSTVAGMDAPNLSSVAIRPIGDTTSTSYGVGALNENTLTFRTPSSTTWVRILIKAQ